MQTFLGTHNFLGFKFPIVSQVVELGIFHRPSTHKTVGEGDVSGGRAIHHLGTFPAGIFKVPKGPFGFLSTPYMSLKGGFLLYSCKVSLWQKQKTLKVEN